MKKRLVLIFGLVTLLFVFIVSFAYVDALQCPPNSHTWGGDTETSDLVYCIPDVGPSGPVNPDQTPESDTDEDQAPSEEEEEVPEEEVEEESCDDKYNACNAQCEDNSNAESACVDKCWDEMTANWQACEGPCHEAYAACVHGCGGVDDCGCQTNKDACIKEHCYGPYDTCVNNCKGVKDEDCTDSCESNRANCVEESAEEPEEEEEETPVETPEETPEEDSFVPGPDDSEPLLDAVATEGMSREEIRSYYENKLNKALWEAQNTLRDIAQERFDKTPPLAVDVVNAKNDYQDALKKGEASEEELAELEANFDAKAGALRSELNEILRYDPDSVDALWARAVLNKWQGNNELSYEDYRDALVSQQHRNPFQFNDLLDRVRDPATRMQLMQELLPNENIANVPTTETSPFLKWFDDVTKAPVQQVDKAKRKLAEQIDKLANAFSLFKYLPEKLDEINEQ